MSSNVKQSGRLSAVTKLENLPSGGILLKYNSFGRQCWRELESNKKLDQEVFLYRIPNGYINCYPFHYVVACKDNDKNNGEFAMFNNENKYNEHVKRLYKDDKIFGPVYILHFISFSDNKNDVFSGIIDQKNKGFKDYVMHFPNYLDTKTPLLGMLYI